MASFRFLLESTSLFPEYGGSKYFRLIESPRIGYTANYKELNKTLSVTVNKKKKKTTTTKRDVTSVHIHLSIAVRTH